VPAELRERIAGDIARKGLPSVVAELEGLNPGGLGALDRTNPRRVANALGRCLASGRPLAALREDFRTAPGAFAGWEVRLSRIDRPAPELEQRICARVSAMLAAGLVDEVRGLMGRGLLGNPSAARAIGYRETVEHLQGRLPIERLGPEIARDTRALVKKQRTWFRTQLPGHRVLDASSLRDPAELFLG
jgi:tRNA dimethylallyltransferase